MNILTTRATTFRSREYWTAVDDDSYDGPESPVGTGHSRQAAVTDLLEQMEDAVVAFPELTDADRAWILSEIDPEWERHFTSVDVGWEFYLPLNEPEMARLIAECDEDNRAAAQPDELCETLADICRPFC